MSTSIKDQKAGTNRYHPVLLPRLKSPFLVLCMIQVDTYRYRAKPGDVSPVTLSLRVVLRKQIGNQYSREIEREGLSLKECVCVCFKHGFAATYRPASCFVSYSLCSYPLINTIYLIFTF